MFEKGRLQPVAVNPDGNYFAYRIIDPRRFTGVGTTLADTDALASVVALRAGGEGNLPGDVATLLRAASERCDHLVARGGVPGGGWTISRTRETS